MFSFKKLVYIFAILTIVAIATSSFIEKSFISYTLFLVMSCCVLYPFSRVQKVDIFEIIYWVVLYFAISQLARSVVLMWGESPYLEIYDPNSQEYFRTVNQVLLYGIIALLSLYVGYYSEIGNKISQKLPIIEINISERKARWFIFIGLIYSGLFSYFYFKGLAAGGADLLNANEITKSSIEEGGRGIASGLGSLVGGGIFLSLYFYLLGPRKFWVILSIVLNACIYLVSFLIIGSKSTVIYLVINFLMFYNYLRKPLSVQKVLLWLTPIVILSPFVWYFRYFGLEDLPGLLEQFKKAMVSPVLIIEPFLSRSFGADMFFLIVDKTPVEYPFLYGGSILSVIWSLIPRQLWADKPWSLGVEFNRTYLSHAHIAGASVSPSLIGEFYMNFHVAGIVLGFILLGVGSKILYEYCTKRSPKFIGLCVYYSLFLSFVQGIEGPFSDHYVYFAFFRLLPLLVLCVVFGAHLSRPKSFPLG